MANGLLERAAVSYSKLRLIAIPGAFVASAAAVTNALSPESVAATLGLAAVARYSSGRGECP